MKSIGFIIFGIIIGVISSYVFFTQKLADKSLIEFTNGMKSESAATSKLLAELATQNDETKLKEILLKLSCNISSGFLEDVNDYNLFFEGINLLKEDAEIAYRIAKENGVKNCLN